MKNNNQKSDLQNQNPGTLYVVSTPIGNLEDVTLRALKILKDADLIAAENTRQTRGFCSHYNIKTRLISYHQHNQRPRGHELIERLKKGSDIALVTSAGTPSVSDPGSLLVNMALEHGIRVSPIPGPSAAIAALSVSGLHVDRFLFLGFLSNRPGKRKKELRELTNEQRCMVFYEAPHRIKAMLKDMNEILGDRYVVILRELTKIYEEIKRGPVSLILKELDDQVLKGEFTVVLAGAEKRENEDSVDNKTRDIIKRLLRENRIGVKEIATRLSREFGLNYRTVYKEGLIIKKGMES
ncbi:MAG TPA: 16S rRNA (cytidine(1402)-2'-O)-methyltransferase [Desulfatiglandales bacterium]|nr:16S rRNA (cytidine(1402)-2'-O)-methyltransferase [Desulfatiglandales bacterium]